MIRSNFAIMRLLVLPFVALLTLYLMLVVGGGYWLLDNINQVETRRAIREITAALEPIANDLETRDSVALFRQQEPWVVQAVDRLFREFPALRTVLTQNATEGYSVERADVGRYSTIDGREKASELDQYSVESAPIRLRNEVLSSFLIRYESEGKTVDFVFDRQQLLAKIDRELTALSKAVYLFVGAGAISILIAFLITAYAMVKTREMGSLFQTLYQQASISELLYELMHDLRNPLAALRANIQALRLLPDQAEQICRDLDTDILRLNGKLSAFLDLGRRENDEPRALDFKAFIEDVARCAEPIIAQAGLALRLEVPEWLPTLTIQEGSMRDALLNILQNAGQSGQADGEIVLRVKDTVSSVTVCVEDQGEGVSSEELERIFAPYFTTKSDGNGLGLAITRRVVLAHQGQISAENRPLGGLRVTVTLPVKLKELPAWKHALKKHLH